MDQQSPVLYDYIFLGAGCASLSIIMRMIDSGSFHDKKILLINKDIKDKNDRTWCFWENQDGYFESVVCKKWEKLLFKIESENIALDIFPYQYKMIRGIDFYNYCFSKISQQTNIQIEYGEIEFDEDKIKFNNQALLTGQAIVFNSIYNSGEKQKNKYYLLQHFKGWIIETSEDFFNPNEGTIMDFRVDQFNGTTFVYVLPLSINTALVEYTLFTEKLLPYDEYDNKLKKYLQQFLHLTNFKIIEDEFGVIPMTNTNFKAYENGMYNIGTAGGQTKASTGYTFQFIQKQAQQIVQQLISAGYPPKKINTKKRFQFYDSTLLHILSQNKLEGKEIFIKLFKKNKASAVFKFLDNETNLTEELKIISSLPTKEFLSAGIKEFFRMFNN